LKRTYKIKISSPAIQFYFTAISASQLIRKIKCFD
jgi:hypothetical protein